MSAPPYDRLSGLDHTFLLLEGANTHMHVAATLIFEAGALGRAGAGLDIERIRAYVASRLHLIPRYRQRLAHTPLDNHPVWIDDEHFNLDYHVRHTSLPRPGDERQLKRLAARIMSQQLDRAKPLWELWVVEGLEGDRFALVAKTHHCMIDGLAAVDLLAVLLRNDASEGIELGPPFKPRSAPSRLRLASDEVVRLATSPLGLLQTLRRGIGDPGELRGEALSRLRGLAETLGIGLRSGEATPLNRPIGPHRRFDWIAMDLADVREVKKRLGGTLNDVVLATTAGALRTFLQQKRVDVDQLNFRILAPVSMRDPAQEGTLGNQISMWLLDLPIGEADPKLRLDQIHDTTEELKETRQAVGARLLAQATNWTGSTLLSMGVRLLHRALPFHMVVTNVPGPQIPLYLLGARMLEAYPQVPLFMNQGLGVALFSYVGRLYWGFNADWDRVPDVPLFADAIVASFNELRSAALASEAPHRRRRARAPRAAGRPIGEA